MVGTYRYTSLSAQSGVEQCRSDDLEAIGNMLIFFAKGSLPWQGLRAEPGKTKADAILKVKEDTTL